MLIRKFDSPAMIIYYCPPRLSHPQLLSHPQQPSCGQCRGLGARRRRRRCRCHYDCRFLSLAFPSSVINTILSKRPRMALNRPTTLGAPSHTHLKVESSIICTITQIIKNSLLSKVLTVCIISYVVLCTCTSLDTVNDTGSKYEFLQCISVVKP
jgi:hypothetical protein